MKILILTNLYPPHHAGTFDFRCETVTNSLRQRGHEVRVLTSIHGLSSEQRDTEIERRLLLNGAYEHPSVIDFSELKTLETHNHAILNETITAFEPELIYVWSLHGLSKSLIFTLRNSRLPTVYDVADNWIAEGLQKDPWLHWWNTNNLSFAENMRRSGLELSGARSRMDQTAPTRLAKGYDRVPEIFGKPDQIVKVQPNSIGAFRFDRLYFCSEALKTITENRGFRVNHADVIYPGISTATFYGEVKAATIPATKLLLIAPLRPESGISTALEALRQVRSQGIKYTLSIYGRGESDFVAQLRSSIVNNALPVEFLTQSHQHRDLTSMYRQHHAFLHTSEWDEPFATRPLEAMACGLPVIGANIGGVREVFRHRENVLTYSSGDAAELALCLQELHHDPDLRVRMAETAQGEILSRFNETVFIDQVEAYLINSVQVWRSS